MKDDGRYTLLVNGERHDLDWPAQSTLLEVLRDELDLTGSKRGCNQGVCGACTVLVDGRPMRSCISLAAACAEQSITTIEAIADGLVLSPVQQAMVDAGGLQCGFCTSGMVLTLSALIAENPTPTREEVRAALAGNLCRCTGYTKIVDAAMIVAEAAQ
jgi:carbon-monoxide dehydrogenase small subunit